MTRGLAADLALSFFAYDMGFMYQLRDFFQTHDMGVMRLHNGQGCSHFLTHDMGKIEKNLGTSKKNIRKPFFSPTSNPALNCSQEWGGEGLGAQNEAWGGVWAAHASQEWGGKGVGCKRTMKKRFGCFMVSKSGAGRVWEGSNFVFV